MLKILQARLQEDINRELPDVQTGFRKGRRTKLPTTIGLLKKKKNKKKKTSEFQGEEGERSGGSGPISDSLTMLKSLTVYITKKTMDNS